MLRPLIIGASKRVGLETAPQTLEAGSNIHALARSATQASFLYSKLKDVHGDALKSQDVEAAFIAVYVAGQTLGVGLGDLFRPVIMSPMLPGC